MVMSQMVKTEKNTVQESAQLQALCDVVAELLRVDEVLPSDDFFALGGDSITAMALTTKMRKRGFVLKAKDIFTRKVLSNIAQAAKVRKAKKKSPAVAAKADLSVELTSQQWSKVREKYGEVTHVLHTLPLQKGLYFQSQLAERGSNYNAISIMEFRGEYDATRLQQSLDNVVKQYPQLWIRFDSDIADTTLQILVDPHKQQGPLWPVEETDLTAFSDEEQQRRLAAIKLNEIERRFDVTCPDKPLLFCRVVHHGENHHSVIVSEHHLIVDGWSTPMILKTLLDGYQDGNTAENSDITPYATIVDQLTARDRKAAEKLWREQLDKAMPTMAYDGEIERHEVIEHGFNLSVEQSAKLYTLCREQGLTLNTLMQGVWALILGSITGREDVIFGSPISGRFAEVSGIDQQVGLFTNTIPVRMALTPQQTLVEQLVQVQQEQIGLLENDVLGLGDIQRLIGGETLFDTMLSVENFPDEEAWVGRNYHHLTLDNIVNRGYTHYPLTLFVIPGDSVEMIVAYRNGKYSAQRIAQQVQLLIEQIIADPAKPVREYHLQTEADRALLTQINQTEVRLPNTTLRELMREKAWQTPDAPALLDVDHHFSYREMRQSVQGLSNQLVEREVQGGDIVAVALPRSVKLSLAINAVIEAGAVYLPLDVTYPVERLTYMVDDAKPSLVITTSEFAPLFEQQANILLLDQLPEPASELTHNRPLNPEDGAYIIYTSGSTGNPKGVLVSHGAIVNRLAWMQHEYQLDSSDVVLQKTPCSFDVSVWEFFWALIEGASLMMAPPEVHKDPDALLHLIEDYHVTTTHFVPSMLAAFIAYVDSQVDAGDQVAFTLRRVFCSGEALTKELSALYQRHIDAPLHNLYGPTEAAVDVTYCPAFGEALQESTSGGVPIGLPVWNTQLRILDSFLREVPVGVPGELYLTGKQLAVGYLNRSSLTADRFVADPYGKEGERMYRTGDVVRWLSSGKVEYLGRSDDQLKIRGQRIELGEIEACLQQLPQVHQAVVCAKTLETQTVMAGADNRQLVGYAIPLEGQAPLDTTDLRRQMQALLPSHMVPVAIVELAEFPLSANGKLDRKALPLPTLEGGHQGRQPESDNERIVADLFCELLQVSSVTVKDDFFSLGGHSLLCMRLAAEIQEKTGQTLSVGQIIINPSVEALAQCLDAGTDGQSMVGLEKVLPIRRGEGAPLVCINPASGFSWLYTGLLRYLGGSYPIIGLQSPVDGGAIATAKTMDEACDMYYDELKKVQPHGPYHLTGYSFGGNVAHTLAARLQAEGEEVAFVGLFDTYPTECQDWDAAMNEEVAEKEKAAFLEEKNGDGAPEMSEAQKAMLADVDANYGYAVGIMATAKTTYYSGRVHLFVADQTFPDFDIEEVWSQYAGELTQLHIDTRHQDILEPETLKIVGPMLDRAIRNDTQLN
ncbi:amino acid adenylation domain-containing protein [Vibrio sp. CAIM 722]|uniref:Amino acid adenylation domain-containing protein n=1 Tax=Vibrio eleionomae TaxID=2653505 RepID=A0A7X4RW76_9VIBR|nr:non-ribosomal peptide synthetase [Vibrio eleionomae]MZI95363.1 amino acid adenylation domain-containing protein [Vibrio eleionomae]